jgi:transposase InsO family protein
VKVCTRVLGVSSPGYYKYRKRPLSRTQMRRQWLTGLIREVHVASRGTYGSRRVHAELTLGMRIEVSCRLVSILMHNAGSMQIELLNRQRWKTRVELANAMFDYIEIFYNRQRRHSELNYRTPIECEISFDDQSIPA